MREVSVDAQNVKDHALGLLESTVRLMERCALEPKDFYDGDRMRMVDVAQRLMKLTGVDAQNLKRMMNPQPLRSDDPALRDLLSVFSAGRKGKKR